MKFCYVDESGTGDEPYAVMVGVLVDAYRMGPTKSDWNDLLRVLSEEVGREIREFHTRDFYNGNKVWRGIDGPARARVISVILDWYAERKHKIVYSVIEKLKFEAARVECPNVSSLGTLWRTLATHLVLSVQKKGQAEKANKGNTVFVFDAHAQDEHKFAELVLSPPDWTDTFYNRQKNQDALDQIIDVPHFVDSKHVGLIQLADCISFFIRRYVEISEGAVPERYEGEAEAVCGWAKSAIDQSIPKSNIYPKKARCGAADTFYNLAPKPIAG